MHKTTAAPFRLMSAGLHAAPRGRDFALHEHPFWEVVYYREGQIEMVIGGTPHACAPGAILITPPRTGHLERALTDYANCFAVIDADPPPVWPTVCHDDSRQTIGHLMTRLMAEYRGAAEERTTMLDLLLRQLDILIRRAAVRTDLPRGERVVRAAEQVFEREFSGPLEIRSVAQRVGASESALRQYFREARGCTPLQSLHAIRIRCAAELISHTNIKLDAVADLCGFHSASHLTRFFKRLRGCPPGALRPQRVAAMAGARSPGAPRSA